MAAWMIPGEEKKKCTGAAERAHLRGKGLAHDGTQLRLLPRGQVRRFRGVGSTRATCACDCLPGGILSPDLEDRSVC